MRKFWFWLITAAIIVLGILTQGDDGKAQVGLAPFACNKVFQVSQAAVSLTKIVTANNQVITLCGYTYNTGGAAGTMQLEYGTGTNCGTGTTAITPAWSLGVNGVLPDHPGFVTFSLPNNNDLCLVTTGTGPNQVLVYYTVQ